VHINCTEGFSYGISIYAYNVLWSYSPSWLPFPTSPLPFTPGVIFDVYMEPTFSGLNDLRIILQLSLKAYILNKLDLGHI
jgi:hypothetical protein